MVGGICTVVGVKKVSSSDCEHSWIITHLISDTHQISGLSLIGVNVHMLTLYMLNQYTYLHYICSSRCQHWSLKNPIGRLIDINSIKMLA